MLVTSSYLKLFKVVNGNPYLNMSDVVKIDEELLKKIKKLVSSKENRIKYSNAKQFVNIAVLEKLNKEGGGKQ